MTKLILTDADGVLFDWVTGFNHWARVVKKIELVIDPDQSYDICEWFGLSQQDGIKLVTEYNASAAMGFLPAYKDAVKYVQQLHRIHGYQFVVITAMGNDPYASRLRWNNLKDIFGPDIFVDMHITDIKGDKTEYLQAYQSTIWIEDKPANAELGHNIGHTTFLMEHKHNTHVDTSEGIHRVHNWKELYNQIECVQARRAFWPQHTDLITGH